MGRIASAFKRLGKVNEAALIPRVAAGYPSYEVTRQLVPVMARQGADLIELEITSVPDALTLATEARRANEIPLLFVNGFPLIFEYGPTEFVVACSASGVDGLIVPGITLQEAYDLASLCQPAGIDLILDVTPTSTDDDLERIARIASGFISCSLPGMEDLLPEFDSRAAQLVERVQQFTDLPIVLDPGVSTPQQVAEATRYASGVIISNALLEAIKSLPEDEVILGVADIVRELKAATTKLEG